MTLKEEFIKKQLLKLFPQIFTFTKPLDKTISDFFYNNKIGKNERFFIKEVVYYILRNLYKIESYKRLSQFDDFISSSVNKFGNIFIDIIDLLSIYTKNIDLPKSNLAIKAELPDIIIDSLKQIFNNNEIENLGYSLQYEAPLDLRVNILKKNVDTVYKYLEEKKLNPEGMQYSPFGIRLSQKVAISNLDIYKEGIIEIQDESSQIAGLFFNIQKDDLLIDFCAGAGGKSLLFGMLLKNTGHIYAFDINAKRLMNFKERLQRSSLTNISIKILENEHDSKLIKFYNKFTKVFVDAPCSGVGTIRRNPTLKYTLTKDLIIFYSKKQLEILKAASLLVKKNGLIYYATCSFLPEENQDVINEFLKLNKNFLLIPPKEIYKKDIYYVFDNYLQLLPSIHKTDGFFIAILKKN